LTPPRSASFSFCEVDVLIPRLKARLKIKFGQSSSSSFSSSSSDFSGRFEDEEEPGIAHFSDRL
jgi:hypothetical protein